MQQELFERFVPQADVVYTPNQVSKGIIDILQPYGTCLDPCKGDGSFFQYLPDGSKYCEIAEGIDFFECKDRFDWVIGNPPYSNFFEFLQHACSIADNVSFLVPTNKIFQRQVVMDYINAYGGIKSMIVYGSGSLIGFPFGFSVGNFHFQKGYTGETRIIMGMKKLF